MTYIDLNHPQKALKVVKHFETFDWDGFTPDTETFYKIVSPGTTDFTSWGSSNNNVGRVFQADSTTAGSGTGTAIILAQKPSGTFNLLCGTAIDYTPPAGATKVVYEFNSVYTYYGSENNLTVKLQYGSDINNLADIASDNYINSYGQTHTTISGYYGSDVLQVRYVIPAWTGQKTLALQTKSEHYRSTDTDNYSLIHLTSTSSQGNNFYVDDDELYYCPFVVCYSI